MQHPLIRLFMVAALGFGLADARADERAAGVTEKWLQAVSDQGREGLRDDAVKRAEERGSQELLPQVVPARPEDDERYFSDFEVGKSSERGGEARVPYRVTARLDGGNTEERTATLVLRRQGNRWRVVGVVPRAPGERVPSEGGARPASAEVSQWFLALGAGVLVAVVSVVVIEAQPKGLAAR